MSTVHIYTRSVIILIVVTRYNLNCLMFYVYVFYSRNVLFLFCRMVKKLANYFMEVLEEKQDKVMENLQVNDSE